MHINLLSIESKVRAFLLAIPRVKASIKAKGSRAAGTPETLESRKTMKSIWWPVYTCVALLNLLPLVAHATMEVDEQSNLSALISNPKDPSSGLRFSGAYPYESDLNGVCKVLGYEKAVAGSSRVDYIEEDETSLKVAADGSIVSAPFHANALKQIVCINKTGITSKERSEVVLNPSLGRPGIPFNFWSTQNENGVCRALGFDKAVADSSRPAVFNGELVLVDEAGRPRSLLGWPEITSPGTAEIGSIVCLNRIDYASIPGATTIENPAHPDSKLPFSTGKYQSSLNGVCRSIGFDSAVPGSSRSDWSTVTDTIEVDDAGTPINGPIDFKITKIVCIRHP